MITLLGDSFLAVVLVKVMINDKALSGHGP